MKHLILSISLLIPFVLLGQPGNNTIEAFKAEKLFGEGKTLYEQADFNRAIATLNEVSRLNPDHPQVYFYLAESYYALKDYEKALDNYSIAARQHPDDPELRNSQGTAAAQLKLYDAAASYYYEALKINPDHQSAKENLALVDQLRSRQGTYTPPAGDTGWTLENGGSTTTPTYGTGTYGNPTYGTGTKPPYTNPATSFNPPGSNNILDERYPNNTNISSSPYKPGTTTVFTQPVPPALEARNTSRDGKTYSRQSIQISKQTDQSIRILQVQFSESATTITLEVQSIGDEAFPIKLAPAGSKDAFYLMDQSMRRVYRLKNVRGLAGWPNRPYNLQVGERKVIALEFERLPDDLQIFHLLEGSNDKPYNWDFYDIELIE